MTRFKIVEANWSERPVHMRLPFQFGSTEMRETAEAYAQVVIELDGARHTGRSAQLMVPRWFDKRPHLSNPDTIDELRKTIRAAIARAPDREGTAIALTRELRAEVAAALPDMPKLAAGFGPALVEMAMIDALCRSKGLPFWRAARDDLFGLAENAPPDLTADAISRSLSLIGPPRRIALRHTIGFDAPLHASDAGPNAPQDGQPVALEEVIARTGISGFKIKLKGNPDADMARLRSISAVVGDLPALTATLDANEQYAPDAFSDLLLAFQQDTDCERLHEAVRFVEQPFPREIALAQTVSAALPLVIDESDDGEDAFPRALALGWSGTSIKSCKGVLRALLNKARADRSGGLLSGEDLTCQPGLCWQQDTAMMAVCGVRDVERNGHHFAGGLQGASQTEREHFLGAHSDIYSVDGNHIGLRIEGGTIGISSMDLPGFGCETGKLTLIDTNSPVTY